MNNNMFSRNMKFSLKGRSNITDKKKKKQRYIIQEFGWAVPDKVTHLVEKKKDHGQKPKRQQSIGAELLILNGESSTIRFIYPRRTTTSRRRRRAETGSTDSTNDLPRQEGQQRLHHAIKHRNARSPSTCLGTTNNLACLGQNRLGTNERNGPSSISLSADGR
jgi:hypothetical protein